MPVLATRATTPATLPPLEERLPAIGGALRLYGGKPGFLLAAKCRSIHFRRVF